MKSGFLYGGLAWVTDNKTILKRLRP